MTFETFYNKTIKRHEVKLSIDGGPEEYFNSTQILLLLLGILSLMNEDSLLERIRGALIPDSDSITG
jgi:hypothetical protein